MRPGALPSDGAPDATLALLREGYRFIPDRCMRLGTDAFRTRLMGRKAVCLTGGRGIRLLYGADGLTRRGAMPPTVLRLLQDKGSVQQLDGAAHRHRKALFMAVLVEEDAAERLAEAFGRVWTARLCDEGEANVLAEASDTLAQVACEWAGFDQSISGDAALRKALVEMSARAGSVGPGTMAALLRRRRVERQLARALPGLPEGCPARRVATFEEDGAPLATKTAVVEILNLLRPIVAVGRYIAFLARTLAVEPEWQQTLSCADRVDIEQFCEEVRRQSPFFPMVGAMTTRKVSHEGLDLPSGQWVLADLWGTLQSQEAFPLPNQFHPGRQLSWRHPNEDFVPQGGGDAATTHRCPGERVTLALMTAAVRILCGRLSWDLPEQNLDVALNRMPAAPESGVLLSGIRRLDALS
ncbi:cytochrome P450 [Salipiger pallidus]|uniref:Cytochrome P450 n=1 Tax=Salipiger pallidus TaxID=1775170 RepID=A0A8J2ZK09_9RHOB|nr:cytochrome P450 [Salipiger pallidus]GGG72355.1 cytochrome P450 [Salipiger pallidus]